MLDRRTTALVMSSKIASRRLFYTKRLHNEQLLTLW